MKLQRCEDGHVWEQSGRPRDDCPYTHLPSGRKCEAPVKKPKPKR